MTHPSDAPTDHLIVDADIAQARSLPPAAFTSDAVARLEQQHLWPNAWTWIPVSPLPSAPGDRHPVDLWSAPYFLQATNHGLHLHPNVCTHAWHTLVAAPESGKRITCPQHGRVFDTDGTCLGQPHMKAADFPGADDHLPTIPMEAMGPLAFAARGSPSHSLQDILAPVLESLGDFRLEDLQPLPESNSVRIVAGNWKQHASNYLDRLHIPFIHGQGLSNAIHQDSYTTELHGDTVLQWARAADPERGFGSGLHPRFEGHPVFALWWFVWPNLTLNFYPWGLSANLYEPGPTPNTTRFHWMNWAWDFDKAERRSDWFMDDVDAEDVDALAETTRGLSSPHAVRGRFIPEKEDAVHWFHHRVSAALRTDD